MEFFEMRVFFCCKMNNCNKSKKKFFIGLPNILQYAHLFPLHNEPSPMPVGWKLWEE